MNTFDNQSEHLESYEDPGRQAPPQKDRPVQLPPQEDESLPVLPRPAARRAEAFLPEWLRRLAHG